MNEKIMIVDDNVEFLQELKETLYLCGYETKIVSDSANAIKTARKIKPSLILLDLKMGKMNGFQVADELKKSKETAAIPIIAMSGYFPIENRSNILDLNNMDSRIKKPFGISDLITQIELILNKKEVAGLSAPV